MSAAKPDVSPICLIKSTFYNERSTKEQLAEFILNSHRLSMAEKCTEFEQGFSAYQERKYTVLFNSGSSANLALIQALLNLGMLRKGDKVAFSAVTWSTNVMPLIQLGLDPVPVDIERETLNVGSDLFRKVLDAQPDIKAFFISNILGFCSDIDRIREVCDERGVLLLEDNCESFGTVYQGKKLGNYGMASTCSLYVGHHLSTVEGGVVCTDSAELCTMLKIVRAHGWDRNLGDADQQRLRDGFQVEPFYDLYTFYDLGFNLRPTEITGFLGILQLEIADEIIARREKNFRLFHEAAKENGEFLPVRADHVGTVSNFAYPVICGSREAFASYREKFAANGVEIRPIVGGNMVNQPFFRKYSTDCWELPNADFVHDHGFYFPNNPELSDEEIARIVALLKG